MGGGGAVGDDMKGMGCYMFCRVDKKVSMNR